MNTRPPGPGAPRAAEGGAILLIVLILSVTLSLLAMALVSTAELSVRADGNADDLERAGRGARSGIEWAVAGIKQAGPSVQNSTVTLDSGVVVNAQARLAGSPRLIGKGTSNGVEVTIGADYQYAETTRPYAFMSFADTNAPNHTVTIDGLAYLGEPNTPLKLSSVFEMSGDLDLVSKTALAAGQVVRSGGATNLGVTAITMPPWDTSKFVLGSWTVPRTTYSGTTTLSNQTLTGLVVATLGAGQTLTLDNVTLNGTLVVPWLYPPALDFLGTPTILMKGATINGGTAETGNLAILAPGCLLKGSNPTTGTITGVAYVRQIDAIRAFDMKGQMLVRLSILGTGGPSIKFGRVAGWLPDVPVGINWGGSQLLIQWRGRQ